MVGMQISKLHLFIASGYQASAVLANGFQHPEPWLQLLRVVLEQALLGEGFDAVEQVHGTARFLDNNFC